MMNSIEITIGSQKYILKSEESEDHLREVADLVKRRVESLKKKSAPLSGQKAAMLASFDFASEVIKLKRRSSDYRSKIVTKAQEVLQKLEIELESRATI